VGRRDITVLLHEETQSERGKVTPFELEIGLEEKKCYKPPGRIFSQKRITEEH